ncbi:hypothetical protein DNTS_010297, partial [Danionella cerebrum]
RDRAVADSEQQGVVLLSNTHAALDDERRRPCAKAVCWGPEIIRKHRCASGNTVVARRMRSFQDVSPCSGATRRQSYFTRIRICVESSEMFEDLMNVSSGLRALCCERMLFVHQLQTRISARGSHAPVVLSRGAPGSTSPEMSSDMRLSDVTEQLAQTQELVSQLKDLIREKDAALCARDDQQKELTEQIQRLQNERESFQSKLEAERHIARARLKDLMEKQEADLRRVKLKEAEASKAESKFLKMKAWSKSRIRQLEEELRRAQTGRCLEDSPDVSSLHRRVAELQEEREDLLGRLEMHEEVKARNEELQKQLLEFKEQQRKMQADLEQVTQRASQVRRAPDPSTSSLSGSNAELLPSQGSEAPMEDVQLMEWQEMVTMVTEAEESQDEKNVFRMSHMEEEREAPQISSISWKRLWRAPLSLFQRDGAWVELRSPTGKASAPHERKSFLSGMDPPLKAMVEGSTSCLRAELRLSSSDALHAIVSLFSLITLRSLPLSALRASSSPPAPPLPPLLCMMGAAIENSFPSVLCMQVPRLQRRPPLHCQQFLELFSREVWQCSGDGSGAPLALLCLCAPLLPVIFLNTCIHLFFLRTASSSSVSPMRPGAWCVHKEAPSPLDSVWAEGRVTPGAALLKGSGGASSVTCAALRNEWCPEGDDWLFPGCSDPALANRQQEVEEELAQVRGLGARRNRKQEYLAPRSLQEEFAHTQDVTGPSDPDALLTGENMGGWWPQHSAGDTDGLRSVVEELELERNQLQEQIQVLEKQCQDLEERLQLQARVELLQATFGIDEGVGAGFTPQNESERLRSQLASLRSQQLKDSEKHQLVISKLNKELKGLSSTQECLESSLLEKEHSLARTSEKLEHIESLREAVADREKQNQEQAERLLQAEHSLAEMKKTCSSLERENSELKAAAADQTLKLNSMKDKAQKQESSIEALQCDLQQTNEDLERLNAAHLEERAQLLHDLQSCEREIDRLQDILTDKDKEILALASSMAECSEQIQELKQEVKLKEEVLANAERSVQICSDPELSGALIPKLIEQLKKTEGDLKREQVQAESRRAEVKDLMKRMEEAQKTIQDLQTEAQSRPAAEQALGKEERNMLLAEVSKQKAELLVLTKQLEEQVTSHRDAKEKSSKIASLEQKVKNLQEELDVDRERFTSEVRTRDEAKDILEKHLSGKLESIKSLEMDKQKLEETVEQLLDELGRLKHHLEKATLEIEDLREQQTKLQRLSSENSDMKLELEALSGVSEENSSLQSKLSEAHRELSRCSKATEDLQKDLNQLSLREEELRRSKQSLEETVVEKEALGDGLLRHNRELGETLDRKQQEVLYLSQAVSEWETKMLASLREKEHLASQVTSFDEQRSDLQRALNETTREREALLQTQDAEIRKFEEEARVLREQLLEKASECDLLTKALRETNEELDGLRQALESSGAEVLWFQKIALEKDQVLSEQHTQMEASRKLLEERMATLEKQAHAHGTGLTEKMVLLQEASEACGVLRREVNHERELVCSLQEEKSSLKEELSRLHLALEAKEKALAERTLECQKRSESLVSLTGQLGLMSTNTARLESSNASLSDALAQRSAEDTRAKEELARMQLELVEHRDRGQALMEQNVVLKSELKNSVAEVLRQQEKITSLQNQLESRSLEKVSLEQRLRSEMDSLRQTLQEKEEMLRTQEMCVQLLESKGQIISELQEEIQRLRITLQDKDQEITLVMAQLEAREARLRAEVEASAKLQEELKSAVEQLDGSMLEKDSPVMQEKEKVEHIQSRTSELELMVPQLNCRIEQMKRLVDTQAEKLQLLSASQSQIQTLEERNKSLQEERDRTQQELLITSHERALKEQEIHKLTLEREEVLRSTSSQIQRVQDLVQQLTWPSGTRTEARRELVKEERPHVTETIALQRSDGSSEPWVQLWSRLQQLHLEMQRRDSAVLQLSASMEKAAEEKRGLCSQLSSVSRMLKDSQQTAGELQNRCYWLERQLQSQYSPAQASVPPGAPQEPVGSSFSPDGSDGRDLRNRLSEAELQLSQLSSRLEEERSRREAAEEALHQRRAAGVECKQAWHPQEEFSVQLENTDEEQFEELIIRPKQRLFLSKMNGGLLLCRRLLAGRSAPSCSRLLRARLKPRYLFLSYVLLLHLLLLICLGSAL